ncbi:MAG: phage virion morphogenesis protein [Gammaproteobacteria bacterium]|nr:phage virion morphogenesis protein [Gammaproteobacteria bacterium]MCP5137439.1 phage virion morphogenesis protein [Gammaproteobacteria bacterium]
MIKLQFDDAQVRELANRLHALGGAISRPAMQDIGEQMVRSTRQRFAESKAPDGTPWEPNSETTLARLVANHRSKKKTRTGGRTLTQKGVQRLAAKKPLIGESKSLSTQIHYQATDTSVTVGST